MVELFLVALGTLGIVLYLQSRAMAREIRRRREGASPRMGAKLVLMPPPDRPADRP